MDRFNKLYEKQGFLDRYNGSVFGMLFILTCFFVIFSYFYVKKHMGYIRANWVTQRCSPTVIPFAGLINADAKESKLDYTAENFNYCLGNIIKDTFNIVLLPIKSVINIIHSLFSDVGTAINDIRKVIDKIRNGVEDFARNIMQRILLVVIPIQKLIIKVKDVMGKSQGTMIAAMFTAMGGLYFGLSVMGVIYGLLRDLLIALAALIGVLWATFQFDEAALATALYAAIAPPIALVDIALGEILSLSGMSHCFKKGTLVRASNGTLYSIESLPLGTQLYRGGKVTSLLKLSAKEQTMYRLGNVIVSGTHQVKYEKEWLFVQNHPDAVEIPEEEFEDEFIYCLNTSKKSVNIGDYTFMDWDEVNDNVMSKLGCVNKEDIYYTHENGFHPATLIETKDRGYIRMCDINVGDILKRGEKVTGTVKIMNDKELYDYGWFLGTDGLSSIQNLGEKRKNLVTDNDKPEFLTHLLTDKEYFYIGDCKLFDYNKNIDFYLSK
jgi:hypothetical protein